MYPRQGSKEDNKWKVLQAVQTQSMNQVREYVCTTWALELKVDIFMQSMDTNLLFCVQELQQETALQESGERFSNTVITICIDDPKF